MNVFTIVKRIQKLFLLIVFLFGLVTANNFAQSPRIFINEFLASNLTTNPDMVDFDDFSDWIELYNDENSAVDIGGFYITDDLTQPMKWQIPANTIIPAKGYLLIWADGYDDVPGNTYIRSWWPHNEQFTTKWCHTNFKLNNDGDEIGLFNASGNKIDSVVFNNGITDVTYGRKPDGSNNWFYFGEPTPLSSNTTVGLSSTSKSADVNVSIEGGFYQGNIQVALSSASGNGTIRYTTDGSKPKSTSTAYSSMINISSNTILRARVFENSKLPGDTKTNSYFIGETRNLPAVSMVTNPLFLWGQLGIYSNTFKEREIPVSLEYFPLNLSRAFSLDAGVRIGGENIYRFAEKPLNIYMRSDYGHSHISYQIFDELPYQQYDRLYLRNGGDDWPFTIMRDGLQANLLKNQISNSVQAFKPSVLYLNGNYWGIYNLREKIDEQYFLLHYDVDPSNLDHLEANYTVITGDSTDFMNLLNLVQSVNLNDSVNYAYVSSRVDIHNIMDFVIAQDYFANSSWGHNREIWRDNKSEKLWRWILVDMDRGFDADRVGDNRINDIYSNFTLFHELCANQNFRNEFIQRYAERMNHTFNYDRVVGIIDSLSALIENEMPRHTQKWGTYIDSLTIDIWGQTPGIPTVSSWNYEIQKLRTFASQRGNYASEYLSTRFGLSGKANLFISSNVQNEGKVSVNDFFQTLGEDIPYFKDVPITLKAYPPPGYKFKQWIEIKNSIDSNLISTDPIISYTLTGDTEIMAEFEQININDVPINITQSVTLTKANSPYFIQNDITIESAGTLTVEPGVVIYFSSGKSIYVYGKLLMQGTKDDSITMTSYYPFEKWGAVCFNSANGTSELNYVNISNATNGNDMINFFASVSSYNSTVNLSNVHFENVKFPVSSQLSDMTIDACEFEKINNVGDYINCNSGNLTVTNSIFYGNKLSDMDAIDIGFMIGTTRINNNTFIDFTGNNSDGIDLGDASINVEIKNNIILNCGDKGISIGQGSRANLERNTIAGCSLGVGIKDSISYADIRNCTFYSNNVGVSCFQKTENKGGGSADVLNSIFADSKESSYTVDNFSSININYSISNTDLLPGQQNIIAEPLMINPDGANFHLQTGSPCIDSGDPNSHFDDDNSPADIGAFIYAGVASPIIVINEINYNSASDFDSEDWIELYNRSGSAIDISGWVFMDENRTPSYVMTPGTILQGDGYLVIARDLTMFQTKYPDVVNVTGSMNSGLNGGGEIIFLYNSEGKLVDSLTYDDNLPWPVEADGNGSSLELKNPALDNSKATYWSASIGHGTPGKINSTYIVGVKDEDNSSKPSEFSLLQNFPNPFNPVTNVRFEIPEQSVVHLTVYNILGKQVDEIVNKEFSPGIYSFKWDGSNFSSGVYLLQIDAHSIITGRSFNSVKKLILLK